jgi:hypothetical protein
MVCKRRPLEDREIEIIRNLKKKLKFPVVHIAKAVGRNKTSVYKALKLKHVRKSRKNDKKRGAPKKLTKNETMTKPRRNRDETTCVLSLKRRNHHSTEIKYIIYI